MSVHRLAASAAAAAILAATGLAGAASAQTATPTPIAASQQVSFKVILPMTNTAAMQNLLAAQQSKGNASYHQWLTPAQVAAQFGPSPQTVAQVEAALTAAGLQVSAVHMTSIDVVGTAGQIQTLLQTKLQSIPTTTGGTRIVAATKPVIPQTLSSLGVQVFAFNTVRERHVHSTVLTGAAAPAKTLLTAATTPANRNGPYGYYWYNDLKQAYDYPAYTSLNGAGVQVAIVMENTALTSDVQLVLGSQGFLTTTGASSLPTFTQLYTQDCFQGGPPLSEGLYGAAPAGYTIVSGCGFDPNNGSGEASLDTQMVVGGAPGANTSLITIPNLSDGAILDAYENIIDSGQFAIVSNSFGGCELDYTPAYNNGYDFTPTLSYYDLLFTIGNIEGTTWIFSSGDSGGMACPSIPYMADQTGKLHLPGVFVASVELPAADSNVTAVGGGNLQTAFDGSLNSAYVGENGFGDPEVPYDIYGFGAPVSGGEWGAGGGKSTLYGKPAYQTLVTTNATTRAVPDLGMQVGGCPGGLLAGSCPSNRSFVLVAIDGGAYGLIGTSVAAPEFAGALALYVQQNGPQGNINTMLYSALAAQIAAGGPSAPANLQAFHMNISGFDGYYNETANAGYNFIYGNGSPDIRVLFGMTSLPAAGQPQTPSNP